MNTNDDRDFPACAHCGARLRGNATTSLCRKCRFRGHKETGDCDRCRSDA